MTAGWYRVQERTLKVACRTGMCRIISSWLLSVSWKCAMQQRETGVTEAIKTGLMPSVVRRTHVLYGGHISDQPSHLRLIIQTHKPGGIFITSAECWCHHNRGAWSASMFMRQKEGFCLYCDLYLTQFLQLEGHWIETLSCSSSTCCCNGCAAPGTVCSDSQWAYGILYIVHSWSPQDGHTID